MMEPNELGLLMELASDPRWQSILEKLKREPPAPYKPEMGDGAFNDWVHESGRYRENLRVLQLLTGESNVGTASRGQ